MAWLTAGISSRRLGMLRRRSRQTLMGVFDKAKMQGEIGSDADLDSVAAFFESALAGILSDHLKSGPKPCKSRRALRNFTAFAGWAYMESDR